MLPQVAHRSEVLPTKSTPVLPLEGRYGQNPSRTTRTCDPGVEGRIGIRVGTLMLPQVAHRGKEYPAQSTTVLPLKGCDGQSPSRTTRTCDPGVEGVRWDGFADAFAGCSQK
jgi:hypothetical protein